MAKKLKKSEALKNPLKIKLDGQYKTRDGRKVRIYTIESNGQRPVHGAYLEGDVWTVGSWTIEGFFFGRSASYICDIIGEWIDG